MTYRIRRMLPDYYAGAFEKLLSGYATEHKKVTTETAALSVISKQFQYKSSIPDALLKFAE